MIHEQTQIQVHALVFESVHYTNQINKTHRMSFCLFVFFARTAGPTNTKFGIHPRSDLWIVLRVFSSTT